MEKLARMLLKHLDGILNYCRTKVPMGVVEARQRKHQSVTPQWSWLQQT
jgi:transposase